MSVAVKKITTGYSPRELQAKLHLSVRRFNVIVCHRRFGKTVWSINHMIDAALRNQLHNPQYAYLAPTYGQAKRVAWEYLKQYTSNIPGVEVNEADLRVDIPRPHLGDRVRFMLLGAENPVTLKGIYLDGVILDEYGEMNPVAWREVIRPTLSDRGGWAIFIGTFKGRNHFYAVFEFAVDPGNPEPQNWFRAKFKASETGIISKEELASARASMTEEEYNQEYECEADAGMVGAYYTKELATAKRENRITKVPHDPALLVDTYWDLGLNDVMAVWFVQMFGSQPRVIRYMEGSDLSIPEWVKLVKQHPYNFGRWVLPHDAAARDLSTGHSREKTFQNLVGVRNTEVLERTDPLDGIHAVRLILSKCVFDEENCKKGLEALANYQRKWDAKANVFSLKPLHNWASNGADAFRTFAMGYRDRPDVDHSKLPPKAESDYDVFAYS